LVCLFFGALAAANTHLIRLNTQHFGDAHTQLLGLNNGGNEASHIAHVQPVRHVAQRFTARLAQADFVQHSRKGAAEIVIPFFGSFCMAGPKPSPASTQMVNRSSASGRPENCFPVTDLVPQPQRREHETQHGKQGQKPMR
jgi:hypothetical protein